MKKKLMGMVVILIFLTTSCGKSDVQEKPSEEWETQIDETMIDETQKNETQIDETKTNDTLDPEKEEYFEATVLEIMENQLLVEPAEGSFVRNSADKVVVSLQNIEEDIISSIEVGSFIGIYFDGIIAESYPAQIHNISNIEIITVPQAVPQSESDSEEQIIQEGANGNISISVPVGWSYELCEAESESLILGEYGIHLYPNDVEEGFIELAYMPLFAVCGTGLTQEEITLAGDIASVGYYNGVNKWDFISFKGKNENIVAVTESTDQWTEENIEQVMEILNSMEIRNSMENTILEY